MDKHKTLITKRKEMNYSDTPKRLDVAWLISLNDIYIQGA